MNKVCFFILFLLTITNIFSNENTISLGFITPFTFISANSEVIVIIDEEKYFMSMDYKKNISSIGLNIIGKFTRDNGWGGMFILEYYSPYLYSENRIIQNELGKFSGKVEYNNNDSAFVLGAGGGVIKRFFINDIFHIAIDFGTEDFIGIIENDTLNLFLFYFGLFSGVTFEFHFSKNLFLNVGINYNLLLGLGSYHYIDSTQIETDEFVFNVYPCIGIGYKF